MDPRIVDQWSKYKWPILLCLVGIVLILGGLFLSRPQPTSKSEVTSKSYLNPQTSQLKIDISGAITSPGVYEAKEGDRIVDAINLAGGLSPEANLELISKSLNLSIKLVDGLKIYIPYKSDTQVAGVSQNTSVDDNTSRSAISINSSSQKDLESLPGIGPVTAVKIIDNRPYQSVEDLLNKKVIGRSVYDKIKGQISL